MARKYEDLPEVDLVISPDAFHLLELWAESQVSAKGLKRIVFRFVGHNSNHQTVSQDIVIHADQLPALIESLRSIKP
jgi:hypothetical protein